jgi:hypothetical protein
MLKKLSIPKTFRIGTILIIIFFGCKDLKKDSHILSEKTKITNNKIENLTFGCGFIKKISKEEILIYKPKSTELEQIKNITAYSGIPLNFEIYEANIQNAVATLIDNERYILYDPKLLDFANESTNSYWSSISILAHEIGHHLSGHTLNQLTDNHIAELEADKFSGFVMYKMGATEFQAIQAINSLGSLNDTESHPSKSRRIEVIKNGWQEAYELDYRSAIPPPLKDNPEDFYEYTMEMLYNDENVAFYNRTNNGYDFMYGVITDSENKNGQISNFTIEIVKTGKDWENQYGNLDNKRIQLNLDYGYGSAMCSACKRQFSELIKAGRRIKFAFDEGRPDGGSLLTGVFFASYVKAINQDEIDFYLRNTNTQGLNKIINDFLIAEENRDINEILSFYSQNVNRYWSVNFPSRIELTQQYKKAWNYTENAQNLVQSIERVNINTCILKTNFRFFDKKRNQFRNIESKVKFEFDKENKIIATYGA